MLEFLFELVGELLLQLVVEALAQAGVHVVRHPDRPPREYSPWVIAVGYLLFGLIAGALSLWLFPDYLIRSTAGRIAYLVLGPVAAGAAVAAIGLWRSKRGVPRYGIDRFAYGYLFALSFALLRHGVAE
jgi:uncharacterized membrane protein YeaQ/YmgE (transglycosylase-associated protein family)